MKTTITLYTTTFLVFAAIHARADIIAGPITNPANGHDYYLLSTNTWTIAEAEAESLRGTLAIINDADEHKWVFSTFDSYCGENRRLWIGLHKNQSGAFVWVKGGSTNYWNWGPGQPDNNGGAEDAVHLWAGFQPPGTWNDASDATLCWGVVELPGKANEIPLSKAERALLGVWFERGQRERPCWIAGTENELFVIQPSLSAARAGLCADGTLVVSHSQSRWPIGESSFISYRSKPPHANAQEGMRGEATKDTIFWSNGTWWSRTPSAPRLTTRSLSLDPAMIESWGKQKEFFQSRDFEIVPWARAKAVLLDGKIIGGKQYHTGWVTLYGAGGEKFLTRLTDYDDIHTFFKEHKLQVKGFGTE